MHEYVGLLEACVGIEIVDAMIVDVKTWNCSLDLDHVNGNETAFGRCCCVRTASVACVSQPDEWSDKSRRP